MYRPWGYGRFGGYRPWGHRRFWGGWPLYDAGLLGPGIGWGAYGWPYYWNYAGSCWRPQIIRTYWGWRRRWVNVCGPWGYPGWGGPGLYSAGWGGWW